MDIKNKLRSFGKRLRRAFTITELVIVIAVIAILAAVLIPTFSNVINNSKKAADEAMLKQLNVATYNYAVQNPGALTVDEGYTNCDVVFTNLMAGLKAAGYTDVSNPYLLACDIKQDDKYLIWYYESNTFGLVDDITAALFATNYAPNFYTVTTGDSSTYGFLLSNYNSGDKGAYAAYYYAKATSGDAEGALKDFVAANSVWGAAVNQYLINDKAGLTTAGADVSWATTVGDNTTSNQVQTVELKATTSAAAAKNLVSILSVVSSGNTLKNTVIKFEVEKDASGNVVPVDLSGAAWTPVSDAHRDSMASTSTLQGSVDFSGTVIEGLSIENDYISASASYQGQSDNGYNGGGYNVTYGLFGCLNGLEYPVEISNLTLTDCQVVLNGGTTSVGGVTTMVITDCAGLVAGFAVGNVSFKNVTVGSEKNPCYIEGYDAVGGLVGRYYSYDNKDTNRAKNPDTVYALEIDNCQVYANVYGERRAGGFVGYTGSLTATGENKGRISITNSTFEGLIYDDGVNGDTAQYGALIGGMGSAGTADGATPGFYVNNVNITTIVVAKNLEDYKGTGGALRQKAKPVALSNGRLTSAVLYTGYDAGVTVGADGLTVNTVAAVKYTGAKGGSNTYDEAGLVEIQSGSYTTLLPYMLIDKTNVTAVILTAGQYLVGTTLVGSGNAGSVVNIARLSA